MAKRISVRILFAILISISAICISPTSRSSATLEVQNINVVGVGDWHTCATVDTRLKCWGNNRSGQLGDNTTITRILPVDVVGLIGAITDVAGGLDHTCVLVNGGVKCWGHNGQGQLGDGTYAPHLTPAEVNGLSTGVTDIDARYVHTCAVVNGGAKCWGMNFAGQLGDGTTTTRNAPVDVSGLSSGIVAVATGPSHSCALTDEGGVKCWGSNSSGQLGDGTTTQRLTPVDVSGLITGVIAIAAGNLFSCALTNNGGVKCWGYNSSGQLGNGTYTRSLVPVDVVGLANGVQAITVGSWHSCALTNLGGVKCWGSNQNGQLGDGTTTNSSTPVNTVGLSNNTVSISAGGINGEDHTCAIISNGSIKCWGFNQYGQIGDGTTINKKIPVDVIGFVTPPTLSTNYTYGQPGSFFTLVGADFPPSSTATIVINGLVVTDTLSVDNTGVFTFTLETSQADLGFYYVTAKVNPIASTSFVLDLSAPLRSQENSGPIVSVPSGIAFTKFIHLPIVQR